VAADIWGSREDKYRLLSAAHTSDLPYQHFSASPPAYLFKVQDEAGAEEYAFGWKLPDVFSVGSMGIVTARDHISIGFDDAEVLRVAAAFRDSRLGDTELCKKLDIPVKKGWDVAKARTAIRQERDLSHLMQDINYRPFDTRRIFYHRSLVWGMSWPTMQHIVGRENIGLSTTRSVETGEFRHAFCSNKAIGHHFVSLKEVNYFFPLWLYPKANQLGLLNKAEPNLTAGFISAISKAVSMGKQSVGSKAPRMLPGDVFAFVYSILHSANYRSRYSVFLRQDFPRIPLPGSAAFFEELAALGGSLVALHAMESPDLNRFITVYKGPANPEVGRVGWSNDTVWLDATASKKGLPASAGTVGFQGVSEAVWKFQIGSYQVCDKWLKDRKGRKLSRDDIEQYQKIVVALSDTIRIMKRIDDVIEKHGGWPGAFQVSQAN
jgi:predicted helicase